MSLYKQWVDLMEGQTDETFESFWEEYSSTEKRIYEYILSHKDQHLKGKFSDLVEQFDADTAIFMGFLDGINTSLKQEIDLDEMVDAMEAIQKELCRRMYIYCNTAHAP